MWNDIIVRELNEDALLNLNISVVGCLFSKDVRAMFLREEKPCLYTYKGEHIWREGATLMLLLLFLSSDYEVSHLLLFSNSNSSTH